MDVTVPQTKCSQTIPVSDSAGFAASRETTPVAFSSFKKKFLNQTADVTVRETGCHRRCGPATSAPSRARDIIQNLQNKMKAEFPAGQDAAGPAEGSAASSWPPFALGSAPFLRSRWRHLAFLAP